MSEPALRLVEDDGTHHEIARLNEQISTLVKALDETQDDLAKERAAAQVFHQKWKNTEAQLVRRGREEIQDARVDLVWELWLAIRRGPPSSTPTKSRGRAPKLTEDRKKLILARLKEGFEIEDFWMAFYGAERNLWQNRQGKWMDTIEAMCAKGSTLETYRNLFRWELAGDHFLGAGGVKAYADRRWALLVARSRKPSKGMKFCERCAKEIPTQEQTGLCAGCHDDLMPESTEPTSVSEG